MKTHRVIPLLVLTALTLSTLLVSCEIARNPQPISDCTYLITVLENTINYAVNIDRRGEFLASIMLGTPVDPSLQSLHRQVYKLILDYYSAMNSSSPSVDSLRSIYRGIDAVSEYTSKLQGCSKTSGVVAVATRIMQRLESLKTKLVDLITLYSTSPNNILVQIPEKTFEPGEYIPVQVTLRNSTCSVNTASLVYNEAILESSGFNCNGSNCTAYLRTPPANIVQGVIQSGVVKYSIVIRGVCSGVDLRIYRFIDSSYSYPQVYIDAPPVTTRGDVVNLTLYSSIGELTGVLLVKNSTIETPVLNITITNNPREYPLQVDKPLFTIGLNVLKICVNSTEKTLSHCFEKPIIVQPRTPGVVVEASSTSITWTGSIPVYVGSVEGSDYILQAYLDNRLVFESRVSNTGVLIVYNSLLPLSTANLTVVIRDPRGVFDEYTYSVQVAIVNATTILLLLIGGSAITTILREHERLFILALRTRGMRGARRLGEGVSSAFKIILEPYILGLGSSIAKLYYSILRKLRVKLPEHYETLREHYTDVVAPSTRSDSLRNILWRLLLLSERDMYSRRKPSLREAEELYKGALSGVKEE